MRRLWLIRSHRLDKYDVAEAFIVCATSWQAARQYASEQAGDEGRDVWLSGKKSTCKVIGYPSSNLTKDGVVLRGFHAG